MKCDKCFFCTKIGKGIIDDFPMKYCKLNKTYKIPFVDGYSTKTGSYRRQLDFSNYNDCKIWSEVGCDIHPATVAKAKRDALRKIMEIDEKYDIPTKESKCGKCNQDVS